MYACRQLEGKNECAYDNENKWANGYDRDSLQFIKKIRWKPSGPSAQFEFSLRMSVFTLAIVNLDSNDNVGNGEGQLGMTLLSIWKGNEK